MFIKANDKILNIDINDIDFIRADGGIYFYLKTTKDYKSCANKNIDNEKALKGLLKAFSRNAKSIDLDKYKRENS